MTSATVIVSSPDTRSERTYDLSLSVGDLKKKLEPVTGIPISSQILSLFRSDQDSVKIKFLDDDDRPLGYFGVVTGMHIKVDDLNPSLNNTGQFMDVSRVEKFEISKDEYERRPGTVKAFKERNKLGRFAESTPHETKASSRNIPVGARCQVDPESGLNKRGTVRYVGTPKFGVQDGAIWVGIEYDEPVGKNDGSVKAKESLSIPVLVLLGIIGLETSVIVPQLDSRLLLAAIYSEVQPITHIRGKCHVRHRDMIRDLNTWRKTPDCFYFYRFFDPYIKKEYEVVRSRDINNVPQIVKQKLVERYEFVVAEKEVVQTLLIVCDHVKRAPNGVLRTFQPICAPAGVSDANLSAEAVRCDSCKKFYHMGCVQPPLAAKPAKGYGWTCAPCSRKREEKVDRQGAHSESPPRSIKGRTKSKLQQPMGNSNGSGRRNGGEEVHYFKMWPFRYFGLYTDAEDTLDPDDLIFPRAATRVVEHYKHRLWHKPEQKYLVDFIDESVRRFSVACGPDEIAQVRMKGVMRPRRWQAQESRYFDREWSEEEARLFEHAIQAYGGAEVRAIQKDVKSRTIPEIVRYYGRWKNEQLRQKRAKNGAHNSTRKPPRSSGLRRMSSSHTVSEDQSDGDDNTSTIGASSEPSVRSTCGACKAKDSLHWWKAPRGFDLSLPTLCDSCSTSWRKYAELKVNRPEDLVKVKPAEKREGTPIGLPNAKRAKASLYLLNQALFPKGRVLVVSDKGHMIPCSLATAVVSRFMQVATAGVSPDEYGASSESWSCELCENEKCLESSLDSRCLMCVYGSDSVGVDDGPGSFLRVAKPTENRGWVHALCAIFAPELQFADASRLRLVEGLSTIPQWKRTTVCTALIVRFPNHSAPHPNSNVQFAEDRAARSFGVMMDQNLYMYRVPGELASPLGLRCNRLNLPAKTNQ
ncbi:hypothetical protein BS47DRAFT_1393978 [Hydnum rufescens UP504]|uniref:Uncharacterized protein n=1 Tax=Hydnum rufescens UP504 TaxID=1448309 RepID=A0A9P6DRY0_9AGAM|nr:hypothetical protein BS47DRAFT_1393978 [Hydnum rufescens UP504]